MRDEQFIDAMRQAVAARGRDYRFTAVRGYTTDSAGTPMYQTPDGDGACLIGFALLLVDKRACPPHGVAMGAPPVLRPLGLSDNVINAAAIAQIAQDQREPWGLALDMFEYVLSKGYKYASYGMLYEEAKWAVQGDKIKATVAAVEKEAAETAKQMEKFAHLFANGGKVTLPKEPVQITKPVTGVSVNFAWVGDPAPVDFVSQFGSHTLQAAQKITASCAT